MLASLGGYPSRPPAHFKPTPVRRAKGGMTSPNEGFRLPQWSPPWGGRSGDLWAQGHATFPQKVTLPSLKGHATFPQRSRYLPPKGHATFEPKHAAAPFSGVTSPFVSLSVFSAPAAIGSAVCAHSAAGNRCIKRERIYSPMHSRVARPKAFANT